VGAGLKRSAHRAGVIGGRTGDIDEVRGFTRQQQVEVLVDADVPDCAQSSVPARRHGFVNRNDLNVRTLAPSRQMAQLGDLSKAGNCPAQFQLDSAPA
jgi:hypothetical protein